MLRAWCPRGPRSRRPRLSSLGVSCHCRHSASVANLPATCITLTVVVSSSNRAAATASDPLSGLIPPRPEACCDESDLGSCAVMHRRACAHMRPIPSSPITSHLPRTSTSCSSTRWPPLQARPVKSPLSPSSASAALPITATRAGPSLPLSVTTGQAMARPVCTALLGHHSPHYRTRNTENSYDRRLLSSGKRC
ncbi:hypothetical protein OH77DRAFT_1428885 [Trametes cingulata]|nr:hypothetical protein OH77DRAFT_1428885 [Trametes cingulata]